jgi:putative ABC transport system permease protein
MNHLNSEHIEYITQDLQFRGLILDSARDEIIDHVCSATEDEMAKGKRFIDAYHFVLKSFGETSGLQQTQKHIVQFENATPRLMLKNYFKIAFRNLGKQRFYSFINVTGLALGIAACLLIVLYILHELSYDRYHKKADRIYRVNGEIKYGGNHYKLAVAPAPLAQTILEEYPEVESAVRFRSRGSYLVKREDAIDQIKEHHVIWTDSTFFKIFSVDVLEGNAGSALREPNSVAISKSIADKYFGKDNALGQTLIFDMQTTAKVTAVYEDMPANGHFRFDILISMAGLEEAKSTNFLSIILIHTFC